MKLNRISYIVPTFNSEGFIKQTIKSIYNGNFRYGDEIIVIDDKSDDDTTIILKELKRQKVISKLILLKRNVGEGKAKNIAIKNSKNRYFFCLDHDNLLRKNSINKLRSVCSGFDAVAFSEIHFFQFHALNVTHKNIFNTGLINLSEFETARINPGFSGNILYKKSAWRKVGGFEDVVLESWNFMYKMLLVGLKVYIVPDSSYLHRYGHESAYTRASKKFNINELLLKAIPRQAKQKKFSRINRKQIKNNYFRLFLTVIMRKIINSTVI